MTSAANNTKHEEALVATRHEQRQARKRSGRAATRLSAQSIGGACDSTPMAQNDSNVVQHRKMAAPLEPRLCYTQLSSGLSGVGEAIHVFWSSLCQTILRKTTFTRAFQATPLGAALFCALLCSEQLKSKSVRLRRKPAHVVHPVTLLRRQLLSKLRKGLKFAIVVEEIPQDVVPVGVLATRYLCEIHS